MPGLSATRRGAANAMQLIALRPGGKDGLVPSGRSSSLNKINKGVKPTMQYAVDWKIDIDADTPYQAALEAKRIQNDTGSTAVYFEITDEAGKHFEVDLWNETCKEG